MARVTIVLEFDNKKNNYEVNDKEVYEYLLDLIRSQSLCYEIETE